MSGASSSAAAWFTRLEPVAPPDDLPRRPDDPRLGEVVEFWRGEPPALRPGRPVLIGFPQDEGVRRNDGRLGAAEAPREIRRWLYRLTSRGTARPTPTWRALGLLDLGNVRIDGSLEETQAALGEVVGGVWKRGGPDRPRRRARDGLRALPRLRRGGPAGRRHQPRCPPGRAALIDGQGHSGSPFRQALEHPTQPLPGERYVCLGAQPHSVSRAHWLLTSRRAAVVCPLGRPRGRWPLRTYFAGAVRGRYWIERLPGLLSPSTPTWCGSRTCPASAPQSCWASLATWDLACARWPAAVARRVQFRPGRDQPAFRPRRPERRWAALVVWNFLVGLARRNER